MRSLLNRSVIITRHLKMKTLQRLGVPLKEVGNMNPPRPLDEKRAKIFGYFTADDGRNIPLYEGYRDRIKSNWREDFWPIIALKSLRRRIALPQEAEDLMRLLLSSRTLPVSLDEFAHVVENLSKRYPKLLIPSGISSVFTKIPVIAAVPTEREISTIVSNYRSYARATFERCYQFFGRTKLKNMSVLEAGCGMGYRVAALAALGVHRSVGIDLKIPDYRDVCEGRMVFQRLGMSSSHISSRVEIIDGDCEQLPFESNQFDLVYSSSVLEHINNLEKASCEMARVLKPGGIMIHDAVFYFGPSGGHASCTLDFPWGHVRLSEPKFNRYLQKMRPHEYNYAVYMHKHLFNDPPISLRELERFFVKAGLSILFWKEHWLSRHLPGNIIWQEANRIYPGIGYRDLSSNGITMVLVK